MVAESPVVQEQSLAAPGESLKTLYSQVPPPPSEASPMSTPVGETVVNGVDSAHDAQRPSQQPNGVVPNGAMAPMYAYPPPGAMYAVGPTPEMYQNNAGVRMMPPPGPYPFPGAQPGQQGHPMPPGVYGFPPMMPPPLPGAQQAQSNGAAPSSPTASHMQPYPPYAMWYPAPPPPGMAMAPPPPGAVQQNGMPPMPMMGHYPPMYPPRPQGDAHPEGQHRQPPGHDQQQQNGASWSAGPSGLPPKEVARTIPCRYFPDCRFGPSCWFLHPGTEQPQPQSPPEQYPNAGYAGGPLPPPVQYGPGGPWDPSGAAPVPNGVSPLSPDASKNPHAAQLMGNVPPYNMMYAPYPYPGGYPAAMYPQQQGSGPTSAAPQSPIPTSQPMSPQNGSQQLQQGPPSQTHSPAVPTPPPGAPGMYPMNGAPAGWYPAPPNAYPPPHVMQSQPPPLQIATSPVNRHGQAPLSPVSPHQGPNGVAQSPAHGPPISPTGVNPAQGGHYPISPPYSAAPLHPRSPHQQPHPLSPQAHPTSQGMYGAPLPAQPPVPVVPPHGRHSRRESMSSMSAMPMGAVLANLDGSGPIDDSRGQSAFREMDNGFGSARRGRGGHVSRGSWGGGGYGSGRKPPCAFFPLGKCKNGDQCRFPHVMPDENTPASPISPRGGYAGSYGRMANGRRPTILGPIEDKMSEMTLKENEAGEALEGGPRSAAPIGYQKPFNSSPKHRGGRPSISTPSTPGHRQTNHLQAPHPSQRIPSADDFPVLGGAATPPIANGQSYGSAWGGPTAAQVLKGGIGGKKSGASETKDVKTDDEDSFRPPVANPVTVEGAA